MPDFSERLQRSQTWTVEAKPSQILDSIVERIDSRQGRVESRTADSLDANLGSRVRFRLFGLFTPKRAVPLHLRVAVSVESNLSARVVADARGDAGFYIVKIGSMGDRKYSSTFDDLFAELGKAMTGPKAAGNESSQIS